MGRCRGAVRLLVLLPRQEGRVIRTGDSYTRHACFAQEGALAQAAAANEACAGQTRGSARSLP